jgi:predicted ABC-type ATPase
MDSVPDTRNLQPTLIVIAGPNGSGKTSLTTQVLQHRWIEGCTYINPDNLARDVFGDWNSPDAVLKAVQLASERRETCLRRGGSMAFESVLSAPDKVEFIERAKARGFFIRVFFVGTDHPLINAARIARRVMEGGHDVPIQKIIGRYAKSTFRIARRLPHSSIVCTSTTTRSNTKNPGCFSAQAPGVS